MNTLAHPLPLLRVQAYERFRDQILQGRIRPGQVLSQRALTELLAVPLAAVRELVPRLEAEGLLRTIPQRGLQIAHVDLKLIHNAYHLRRLLEVEAALRFAATVTDADLALVEEAHRRIVARACHGPVDEALAVDFDRGLRSAEPNARTGREHEPGGRQRAAPGWIGPSVWVRRVPVPPQRSWMISAAMEMAVSSGVRAPRSRPIGECRRLNSSSESPASFSRTRRSSWVRREPIAPT